MQLAVSYDNSGRIMLMFDPAALKNDKGTFGYKPAQGENHRVFDVPQELQGRSLEELSAMLRVDTTGSTPALKALNA
jgi:hypothetical protein